MRRLAAASCSSTPPLSPAGSHSPTMNMSVTEVMATERSLLLDRKAHHPSQPRSSSPERPALNRTRLLLAVSYASFSGILSGMCLLFAKSGVELLVLTLRGQNQFWRWQAWMLVLGLVAFALLQLWYLHKALILADPTLVCPCECSIWLRASTY
jgi:magnesium transporter